MYFPNLRTKNTFYEDQVNLIIYLKPPDIKLRKFTQNRTMREVYHKIGQNGVILLW